MKLKFCSLGSGSSGNCYYLGNEFHGILIDAGISAGTIRSHLKQMGISINSIMGILISHNHFDHIKGLSVLSKKNHFPIFTTPTIWNYFFKQLGYQHIPPDCIRKIPLQEKFHLAGFDIEAFPVSHDAPETIGFHIVAEERKITIVTDLGHICDTSASYIKAAQFLVIESNYDEEMLIEGRYPPYLKRRISSKTGHLSNRQTSDFIAGHMNGQWSHICLAHLSKNNNTPEKALQTLHLALQEKGHHLNGGPRIMVLNRELTPELLFPGE